MMIRQFMMLAALGLTLVSCASGVPYAELPEAQPIYVQNVPFYPQLVAQCGPASLAAVLNYWGKQVTPEEIAREIYVPRLKGSLSLDLWRYANGQNLEATVHRGSLEYLQTHLRQNEPIVASLNLGYKLVPLGHFLVVVGLDPSHRVVIAHSGREKDMRIPFDEFLSAWEKTGYWSLLVKPRTEAQRSKVNGGS
jgi:ABC-type bacteriocin/lantibiotic exporter with double-glycine peptidase domain